MYELQRGIQKVILFNQKDVNRYVSAGYKLIENKVDVLEQNESEIINENDEDIRVIETESKRNKKISKRLS